MLILTMTAITMRILILTISLHLFHQVGIVIFGEIIPQSTFGRHNLYFGAKTVWITRFFMVVLWPVCYPISLLLDKLLGEELGVAYNRDELRQLLQNTMQVTSLFFSPSQPLQSHKQGREIFNIHGSGRTCNGMRLQHCRGRSNSGTGWGYSGIVMVVLW